MRHSGSRATRHRGQASGNEMPESPRRPKHRWLLLRGLLSNPNSSVQTAWPSAAPVKLSSSSYCRRGSLPLLVLAPEARDGPGDRPSLVAPATGTAPSTHVRRGARANRWFFWADADFFSNISFKEVAVPAELVSSAGDGGPFTPLALGASASGAAATVNAVAADAAVITFSDARLNEGVGSVETLAAARHREVGANPRWREGVTPFSNICFNLLAPVVETRGEIGGGCCCDDGEICGLQLVLPVRGLVGSAEGLFPPGFVGVADVLGDCKTNSVTLNGKGVVPGKL
mmetsp:Transcript_14896/g.40836  ORF Transcript_14896/g.40836 Transcript_14896/m.40836 type:complete len:287 (-) Transcript_14896:62-922(-)